MERYLPPAISGLLLSLLLGYGLAAPAVAADKPNIVILFTDDLGYADLGSYGNPYIRTPNIDGLASEGQRWTDFYVAAPVCSPSRGALLTGQLSVRSGLYGSKLHVMFPQDSYGIPAEHLTLAEALKSAGYRTGMFGKWHLGDAPEYFPTRHGFDYWYGIPYSNDMDGEGIDDYGPLLNSLVAETPDFKARALFLAGLKRFDDPKSEYWNVPLYRSENLHSSKNLLSSEDKDGNYRDELVERPLQQPTFTRRLTEEAIRFMRDNREQPFLLYLPYSMPHLPVFSSEMFEGKSLRGPYGDAVEEIDWSVGRIREALEQLNLADNTLVFFSSDNGPWQAVSTTLAGSAGMLRGDKGTTWEGGTRVPGIFWWPDKIKPGVVSDIGSTMDVFATALRLAGVAAPVDSDGLDLSATLFEAAPGPRNEMPFYHKGHLKAYRKGHYKIYFFAGERSTEKLAKPELYDLRQDISERQNIAGKQPEVLQDLLAAVERHRGQVTIAEPIFDKRFQ